MDLEVCTLSKAVISSVKDHDGPTEMRPGPVSDDNRPAREPKDASGTSRTPQEANNADMSSEASKGNEDPRFPALRRFNLVMAVLHTFQGLLMLVVSNRSTLPVTADYVDFDPVLEVFVTTKTTLFDLWLGPMVALFLFISALAHVLVGTVLYDWYVRNLKRHLNYIRWFEYALSSSVMLIIIAMLSGIYDMASLILLFGLNAVMNLMGLMMELHNQTTRKTDWTAFHIGVFAVTLAWLPIFLYLIGIGGPSSRQVPGFVYAIFISIAIFYNSFALNMYLQYKRWGKWRDYLYGERMYIVLSLVSKSVLAWQVFAGTLR